MLVGDMHDGVRWNKQRIGSRRRLHVAPCWRVDVETGIAPAKCQMCFEFDVVTEVLIIKNCRPINAFNRFVFANIDRDDQVRMKCA